MDMDMYACMHSYVRTCMYGYVDMDMYVCMHIYVHTHTHTHTHMAGTTAVGGVVLGSKENGRKVVMANAGDSRAIIAYEDNGRLKV